MLLLALLSCVLYSLRASDEMLPILLLSTRSLLYSTSSRFHHTLNSNHYLSLQLLHLAVFGTDNFLHQPHPIQLLRARYGCLASTTSSILEARHTHQAVRVQHAAGVRFDAGEAEAARR